MRKLITAAGFVAAVVLSWAVAMFEPTGTLFPLLVVGCVWYLLAKRRWQTALLYVLLLPTTFVVVHAIVDYCRGDALFRYSGLPGTTFHNLDPQYRCGRATYGCIVSGNEWISQMPYNATVSLLVTCFGYMPGTYTGPYPSDKDAIAALRNAEIVDRVLLVSDELRIGVTNFHLASETGARLLRAANYGDAPILFQEQELPPIRAIIWEQGCIILSIPSLRNHEPNSAMIVLLDPKSGRPFAYYGTGGYQHPFPPVPWIE